MCTARLQTLGWQTAKRFPPRPSRFARGRAVGKLRVAHPTGSPLRDAPLTGTEGFALQGARLVARAFVGGALAATLLLCLLRSTAALSLTGTTGCALHGASLFFARAKKSKQKKARPNIRPFAARRVPSLHRRSRGRLTRAIHGPLSLSPHPCGSLPYATIPLGLLTGSRVSSARSWLDFRDGLCLKNLNGFQEARSANPVQEAERRRCVGGREAGRRARNEGTGTSLRDVPPEQRRREGSLAAQRTDPDVGCPSSLLTFFLGTQEESESPCKAKPVLPVQESAAALRSKQSKSVAATAPPTSATSQPPRQAIPIHQVLPC